MTIFYKMGAEGDLYPAMQKALTKISHVFWLHYKEDVLVTSKRDGTHSPGSLHYIGRGVDVRYPRSCDNRQKLAQQLREALGPSFDVVVEGNHLHIEYDPKEA